jgi:YegS/Rv2252/BmrU family lipid kinase
VRHHTVIYNPAACQGTAKNRLSEVDSMLVRAGLDFEIQLTREPGHATELAETAARSGTADVVVAAGGDGTANEVINGLMRAGSDGDNPRQAPSLGVLSVGRGNDFAFGCRIPTDVAGGAEVLKIGHEESLDVGILTGGDYPDGRYFGNGIGVGFDTIVTLEAATLRRIRGFPGYLVAALRTLLFYYVTPLLRIRIDSSDFTGECIQVSLMNGQRLGGGFYMAPDAITNDGVFHWCIAGKPGRGQMLGLLMKYMKGSQAESPHVTSGTAREFSATALEGSMPVHADGEIMCTQCTEIHFECIANALRVVTVRRDET